MTEAFKALARELPGEEDEIRALMASDEEFVELVREYESLSEKIARIPLDGAETVDVAIRAQLVRQREEAFLAITDFLIEEEEEEDDRHMV
mgnify:FL=1